MPQRPTSGANPAKIPFAPAEKRAATLVFAGRHLSFTKPAHRKHFPELSTRNPHWFSEGYPQEISMLQCFFVYGRQRICDLLLTATKRKRRGGAQGPGGWSRQDRISRLESVCEGFQGVDRTRWVLRGRSRWGKLRWVRRVARTVARPLRGKATGLRVRSIWAGKLFGGIRVQEGVRECRQRHVRRPRLSTWRLYCAQPSSQVSYSRIRTRTGPV